jgi:hypothetical protein
MSTKRLQIIGRIHLFYLGALPALGTFVVTAVFGNPSPFLIWLVGIGAVGVYLATTMSYTPRPQSVSRAVLFLVDGPLFVLAAQIRGDEAGLIAFAAEGFLVDGMAIWAAIALLAAHSSLPTSGQRMASIAIMLAAMGTTLLLYWPYLTTYIFGNWFKIVLLLAGLGEAIYVLHRSMDRSELTQVDEDFSILYIVGMLFLWMAGLFVATAEPVGEWVRALIT